MIYFKKPLYFHFLVNVHKFIISHNALVPLYPLSKCGMTKLYKLMVNHNALVYPLTICNE